MSVTEKEQAKLIIQEHKVELINEDILETLTESEDVNELIDQTMVENFDSFKASLLESQEAMMALTKQQLKVKDEVIQNQKKMREIEAKKQEEPQSILYNLRFPKRLPNLKRLPLTVNTTEFFLKVTSAPRIAS